MSRVYVAEDSPTQAESIRFMLEDAGFDVTVLANGTEALAAVDREPPDAVLTDLDMPELDGLQLVEALRLRCPQVPVVLMTAFGCEETAVRALHAGAASYVPKRLLGRDLVETLEGVLSLARADREQRRLNDYLTESAWKFRLENDPALVAPVVGHVLEGLAEMGLADENECIRVGVALEEAIQNAIFHGNLELSSDELHESYHLEDGGRSYYELLARRRDEPAVRDRRVEVRAHLSRDEAVVTVRDDGPGFDHAALAGAGEPPNMDAPRRRGLLLIRTFMDEVRFNERGNEITMVKRRRA